MLIYKSAGRDAMLALILVCATASTAVGQWLSLPLPGTREPLTENRI